MRDLVDHQIGLHVEFAAVHDGRAAAVATAAGPAIVAERRVVNAVTAAVAEVDATAPVVVVMVSAEEMVDGGGCCCGGLVREGGARSPWLNRRPAA